MGCGCGKAHAKQVVDAVTPRSSKGLPANLAAVSTGTFETSLADVSEGRRDFARTFFSQQCRIFIMAPGMPSMRPVQATKQSASYNIGQMDDAVMRLAEELFTESLLEYLKQACGGDPEMEVVNILKKRVMAAMTVNIGLDFTRHMKLLPQLLQPLVLIVVMGKISEARTATYGFVAERNEQIQGDRPESKRTPICVRLVSPDLLTPKEDAKAQWQVEYTLKGVKTSTIMQAVEMELPSLRQAISSQQWDPWR